MRSTESARGTGPTKRAKKRCHQVSKNLLPRLEAALRITRRCRWQIFILCLLIIPLPAWLPTINMGGLSGK